MAGISVAIAGAAAATLVAGHEAASATETASNNATQVQEQALQQQKAEAAPYTALGQSEIPTLQSLLNGGPGALQTLQSLPGYEFTKDQGNAAITNAAAASGAGLSGSTLEQIGNYTSGLASTTANSEIGNLLATVGIGANAASGVSSAIGNTANNISNIGIAQGNNNANIGIGVGQSLSSILGNTLANNQTNNLLKTIQAGNPAAAAAPAVPGVSGPGLSYSPVTDPGAGYI